MSVHGVAARCIAGLLVVLAAVFAGPATAFGARRAGFRGQYRGDRFSAAVRAASAAAEPFGLDVVPVTGGELLTKWNGVTAEIRADSDVLARCADGATSCPAAAQKFLDVVAQGRAREGRARIGVVNRAINLAVRPMSDLAQWGVADLWSAPLATLTSGRGDCEDYAIAKYAALIAAGFAEDDLRLVIVRDTRHRRGPRCRHRPPRRQLDRARQPPPGAGRRTSRCSAWCRCSCSITTASSNSPRHWWPGRRRRHLLCRPRPAPAALGF